ncbi:MAG TPA: hypothetical protein VG184_13990 [Acidimicrobiales bacterium]|nr:hypothetical protein [Acidimicrobiales bacterium]
MSTTPGQDCNDTVDQAHAGQFAYPPGCYPRVQILRSTDYGASFSGPQVVGIPAGRATDLQFEPTVRGVAYSRSRPTPSFPAPGHRVVAVDQRRGCWPERVTHH